MTDTVLFDGPHRRRNALTGEWVLVSPSRMNRPWKGLSEPIATGHEPAYDPSCYLCPGNKRAGGERNPSYQSAFVFDNDFAALRSASGSESSSDHPVEELLVARRESGICRVICFSPRHDLSLPRLAVAEIAGIVDVWAEEYERLGARHDIQHVQIFENKGEIMGCSNPHPHGQIWAQSTVPLAAEREGERQAEHHQRHGRTLLEDYTRLELEREERLVLRNEAWVAVVPFWAVWPFETLIVSRRPVPNLTMLDGSERALLADAIKRLTGAYDRVFDTSFPYSAGVHQAPTDERPHAEWHVHVHFYPPLLRSASVRKFLVGYEMLAEAQRDLTPEAAAARLRELAARETIAALEHVDAG